MADLIELAKKAASESGFILGEKIYSGDYYSLGPTRALFDGTYNGEPAVLKVYDDPRFTDEPKFTRLFNELNTSKIIRGPRILESKTIAEHTGWLIMEKFSGGGFMPMPLAPQDRQKFANLFYEYRQNFPEKAPGGAVLDPVQDAVEFSIKRIGKWVELGQNREEQRKKSGEQALLADSKPEEILDKGQDLIKQKFPGMPMIFCHGHFKPDYLYANSDGTHVLTDFAHMKYYPKIYEPAFIIWADWIMSADYNLEYQQWKKGIDSWLDIFDEKYDSGLLRTGLLERALGTIFADIAASNIEPNSARKRLDLLYKLSEDLLQNLQAK